MPGQVESNLNQQNKLNIKTILAKSMGNTSSSLPNPDTLTKEYKPRPITYVYMIVSTGFAPLDIDDIGVVKGEIVMVYKKIRRNNRVLIQKTGCFENPRTQDFFLNSSQQGYVPFSILEVFLNDFSCPQIGIEVAEGELILVLNIRNGIATIQKLLSKNNRRIEVMCVPFGYLKEKHLCGGEMCSSDVIQKGQGIFDENHEN